MSPTIFRPGAPRGEVALDEVRDAVLLAVALGECEPPEPRLARLQAQLTHEGPDELGPARHAPACQAGVDPPVPVGPVGVVEGPGNEQLEFLTPFRCSRSRPSTPFVES